MKFSSLEMYQPILKKEGVFMYVHNVSIYICVCVCVCACACV